MKKVILILLIVFVVVILAIVASRFLPNYVEPSLPSASVLDIGANYANI